MPPTDDEGLLIAWTSWHLSLRDLVTIVFVLGAGALASAFVTSGWILAAQAVLLVPYLGFTEDD
jgi:Na+/H+-dicarboxylate symporter